MNFEWDDAKAASNLKKHGIDFAEAARIFEDQGASHVIDEGVDHDEERYKGIGFVNGSVLVVVYTERGDRIRIISARKAEKREEREHIQERW